MSSRDTVLTGEADAPPRELVDAGAALIQALDAAAAGPDVAFWLRFPDGADWRLLLAEGRLLRHGSRVAQDRIRRLLSIVEDCSPLSPDLIGVSRGEAPAVRVLRSALWTGPGIHGVRIRDNVLNGVRVRRAYVYRVV
jgi:hypothetical protein